MIKANKSIFSKKAISGIVAISIMIAVSVIAVVGFEGWFQIYSTSILSNVEINSKDTDSNSKIETIISNTLFFKNNQESNLTIKTIKIGDKVCNISNLNISLGVEQIDLKKCTLNMTSGTKNVVIVTDNNIYEKIMMVEGIPLGCSLDGVMINDENSYIFYNSTNVPYGSTCSGVSRTCSNRILSGDNNYNYSNCTVDSVCTTLNGGEWIEVPGNPLYGTNNFCVMKYEAKNVGGIPTSQADLSPWGNINTINAKAECQSLVGGDYHLITNAEWMTIARNVETVATNWADSKIGSTIADGGGLKRGNVGIFDSASYNGANPEHGTGRNTKALLHLTNGEEIWDLSGNVGEWTDNTIDCSGGYPCVNMPYDSTPPFLNWEYVELTNINTYGSLSYDLLRPSNDTWDSANGMGYLAVANMEPTGGGNIHTFNRGGNWAISTRSGLFYLEFLNSPSNKAMGYGFRCAYTP